jgi:hypothetical protein
MAPFFSAYFADSPRSYLPPASPRISFLKFSQQSNLIRGPISTNQTNISDLFWERSESERCLGRGVRVRGVGGERDGGILENCDIS